MGKAVKIIFVVILLLQPSNLFSQEGNGIKLGADLVNRYLWRGIENGLGFDGSRSFHFQPTVIGTYKNLEVGYWGSFGISNSYSEYDLWAKYSRNQFFISILNYNQSVENKYGTQHGGHFNGLFSSAGSYAEVTLGYDGGIKFPLYASYNKFFYNDDATYLEAGYRFNTHKLFPMDFTVGMTPQASSYGEKAGVMNLGFKVAYDIKFSEKFKVPVFASVIDNPQTEETYFVFGLTFSSK